MAQPVNTKKYLGNLNLIFVGQQPSHILDNRRCDGLFPDHKLKFIWKPREGVKHIPYCQLCESFAEGVFWERKNGLLPNALYLYTEKVALLSP
ncbi:uncharacterized protein EAE97_004832 [Botrytis byssoidea]|uniref:Uncharacterized protein n=1 Tax=Botrytis byssoidea TaxID=139641 RepID=A0A9P5IRP3_9HELO|nr:uncharacterized protein EAE97_004832 [Botrytis byssoidea]KAF7945794.1 hypothetical protein EAE97_004832 [Botrytis byssoidea]